METRTPNSVNIIHLGPAKYAVDLCDGSERGEYVDQDYILHALGRPHRAINLMYCYYPFDKGWPERAHDAFKDKEISFQWDYPYDDYFTYKGGLNGDPHADVFERMREIRAHGMDVILTLTMDPKCNEEQIRAIGRDLKPFGRMQLRINHEATGDWFSFNKRAEYAEVANFFVKASKLIKEEAPNVRTVICIGGIEDLKSDKIVMEEEFKCTIPEADIWSVDKYLSLHWGWPYDVAGKGGNTFARYKVKDIYEKTKRSYLRYKELNGGKAKPMVMSEFNADGDVTGPYDQIKMCRQFIKLLKEDNADWFSGFTFYQFRDRGRLGLETEDPNNQNVGIKQPIMDYYKTLIYDEDFYPVIERDTKSKALELTRKGDLKFKKKLRFGGFEDADGISMDFFVEKNPVFFELYFEDAAVDYNMLIECNRHWFYKKPGVKYIDLMEAFYKNPLKKGKNVSVRMFTPPASGENDLSLKDGLLNSYMEIKALPKVRIETEPVVK